MNDMMICRYEPIWPRISLSNHTDPIDRIWSVSKGVVKASISWLPKRQPWRLQGSTACLRQKIDRFPVWKTSRRVATIRKARRCRRCDMMWPLTACCSVLIWHRAMKNHLMKCWFLKVSLSCEKSNLEEKSENNRKLQSDSKTVLFWFYLISHDRPLWFCSPLVTI